MNSPEPLAHKTQEEDKQNKEQNTTHTTFKRQYRSTGYWADDTLGYYVIVQTKSLYGYISIDEDSQIIQYYK
jgi:non-ribosomal peptide synthetase component E (peptide arylation enzyme)